MSKVLVLCFLTSIAFLQSAQAATKYEKLKTMFLEAAAPQSIQSLENLIMQTKGCIEVDPREVNQTINQRLKLVSYTYAAGGPEFPEQTLIGIGFLDADINEVDFFKSYRETLNKEGVKIQYQYDYICTSGESCSVGDSALIRVSEKYILFQRNSAIFGYCWFN